MQEISITDALQNAVAGTGRYRIISRAPLLSDTLADLIQRGHRLLGARDVAGNSLSMWDAGGKAVTLDAAPAMADIRSYQADDEDALKALFNRAFGEPRSSEHWRWKYRQNPYGSTTVSVAEMSGELVAHYGGYFMPFSKDGFDLKGLQVGDVMTSPDGRRGGLGAGSVIVQTFLHFWYRHADCADFLYGFNTGTARRLGRRYMGYPYLREVVCFRAPVGSSKASEVGTEVTRLNREWDEFYLRVRNTCGLTVRRDAQYLDWRYLRCPERSYRLLEFRHQADLMGWVCWKAQGQHAVVGDYLLDPSHRVRVLAMLPDAIASRADVRTVDVMVAAEDEDFGQSLVAAGFEASRESRGIAPVIDMRRPREWFSNWRYRWGDSDLF